MSNVDKKSVDGEHGIRLCNYVDVYKNDAITAELDFMPATATRGQIASFALHAGDTVFTKDSETADDIGVPSYIENGIPGLVCGYHLAIARPDPSAVHPRFLYWALVSTPTREQWTVRAAGVTRVGLRSTDMTKVEVVIPPLDEQCRIADFLDTETTRLDRMMALREREAALLVEASQTMLDHALDDLIDEFGIHSLRRVIRAIEQGSSPQCDAIPAEESQLGVLKLSAVNRGAFIAGENKALPGDAIPDLRREVRPGDLLMSRANTPDRVGDVAYGVSVRNMSPAANAVVFIRRLAEG